MRYLYSLLPLFFLLPLALPAQKIKVKVIGLYSYGYGSTEHTWQLNYQEYLSGVPINISCIAEDEYGSYENDFYNREFSVDLNNGLPNSILIGLEGYMNNDYDRCTYASPDDLYDSGETPQIELSFAPGVYDKTVHELESYYGRYKITFQLYYSFGKPWPTEISITDEDCRALYINDLYVCADCPITLKSGITSPNKSNVTYEWQYLDPEDLVWKSLPESNTINYQLDFEKLGLVKNGTYFFRMKVTAGDILEYSEPAEIKLSPPAPKFTISDITSSCPLISNGSVDVDVHYKPIDEIEFGVYPEGKDYAANRGFTTDDPFTIGGVKSGNYDLLIKNIGDAGECASSEFIAIGQYSHIAVDQAVKQITCHGANDGEITLSVSGGEPGRAITFESDPVGLNFERISNREIRYFGLGSGSYSFIVNDDGCSNTQQINNIEIIEPEAVSANISSTALTCESLANGSVKASVVNGGSALDEVKKYNYYLLFNDQIRDSRLSTTETSYTFNDLPAGDYTVMIEDDNRKNCDGYSKIVTVDDNKLIASYAAYDKTCSYTDNGKISITASKGSGAYIFILTGPVNKENATGTFTGLPAGTYSATVKNNDACADEINFPDIKIQGPEPIAFNNHSVNQVSCYGGSDGSIFLTVSGGTSPYSYQWKTSTGVDVTGADSEDITTLPAGKYYLTVTDANNCIANSTVYEISQPFDIKLSVDVKQIKCYGENNGEITISSTGGTGIHVWEYKNEMASWIEFNASTNFSAGSYQVRVVDGNNCIKLYNDNIIITAPSAALSASTVKKDITCHTLTDGVIEVHAEGGNGAPFGTTYYYSINNSSFVSDDHTRIYSGLAEGSYTIRIKDERECLITLPKVSITEPSPVTSEVTEIKDVECYNAATGEITVSASGGVGGYKYQLNSGSFQDVSTFESLKASSYSISVKDANGCIASSLSATVNQPDAAMEITSIGVEEIKCHNGNDGKITATVSGGNENNLLQWQQYTTNAWEDLKGENSEVLDNRTTGTYRLKVTNSAGGSCYTTSDPVVLENPAPLVFSNINVKHVTCKNDADAKISPEVTGGWGSYKYYYGKDGNPVSTEFSSAVSFDPGEYVIRVEDKKGCSFTYDQTISVTEPSHPLEAEFQLSEFNTYNISCNGASDGEIIVNASGGNGAPFLGEYTYSFNSSTFAGSDKFSNLTGGTYIIAVKDGRGCIVTNEVVLNEPEKLDLIISKKQQVACYGESTGFIEVKASGGTGSYSYSINGSIFQKDPLFNDLAAGNYTLLVKDENGCIQLVETFLEGPTDPLSLAVSRQNITCHNAADGALSAAIKGGWGNYTLLWQQLTNGLWTTMAENEPKVSGLHEGSYRIIVTDEKDCKVISDPVELLNPEPLIINDIAVQQVICKGEDNGKIIPEVIGGWGAYLFEYATATEAVFTEFNENTSFGPGAYTIRVKDKEGCYLIYPEEITIHEPSQALDFTYNISHYNGFAVTCKSAADGWVKMIPSGGNGGSFPDEYAFSIDNSEWTNDPLVTDLPAGSYNLTVRDARGCELSKNVILTQPAAVTASLARKNYIKCYGDSTGYIEAGVTGGVAPYRFQINDFGFQDNPRFENLTAGDYRITVTDANGCADEFKESIIQPFDSLIVHFSTKDISCFGGADGEVTAIVHGGNAPYSYSWAGFSDSEPSLNKITAAEYSVEITDTEGCKISDSTKLHQPEMPLTAEIYPDTLSCFGDADGSVKVEAHGGTAPYQYSFDAENNFQDDQLKATLSAGAYYVQVKDNNGCLYSESVEILQPDSLELHLDTITDALCYGDSTGEIILSANGGVGGYNFRLDQQEFDTITRFSQLSATYYLAEVRDKNGCSRKLSTIIEQPEPLSIDFSTTPVICKGDSNGAIAIKAEGGVGEYRLFVEETEISSDTVESLFAGNYHLQVNDGNQCVMDTAFTIIEPDKTFDLLLASKTDISCFERADGEIEVSPSGGYGAYSVTFDNRSYDSAYSFKDLNFGEYFISATDSLGCKDSIHVELLQPQLLELEVAERSNVLCHGDSTGFVKLTATGGNGDVRFTGNSISQPDSLFSRLTAAEYDFFIEDKRGCKDSLIHIISEPAPLEANIVDVVNAACGQSNGEAKIDIAGGIPEYQINWIDGSNELFTTGNYSRSLSAGKYNIFITDGHFCELQVTFSVNDNEAPELQLIKSEPVSCFNGNDGSAEVKATGGSGEYSFLWSDSLRQSAPLAESLASGTYSVSVEDGRGCISLLDVVVDTPLPVTVELKEAIEPTCYGFDDGELITSAFGGTESFSFTWPAGTSNEEGHAFGLSAGEYNIIAADSNGCTGNSTFILGEPKKLLTDSASVTNVSCVGYCDGKIELFPAGGTGEYAVVWNAGADFGNSISEICAGNYTVLVTDANGCEATESFDIISPSPLRLSLESIKGATCSYTEDGIVALKAEGGTIPYDYIWTRDPGFNSSYRESLAPGGYSIILKDANGCTDSLTANVPVPDTIDISVIEKEEPLCFGDCNGRLNIKAFGGTGVFNYEWSNQESTSYVNGICAGEYKVTVTDGNNCIGDFNIVLGQPTALDLELIELTPVSCYGSEDGAIKIGGSGGTGVLNYFWRELGSGSSFIQDLSKGEYKAFLSDDNGCRDSAIYFINEPSPLTAKVISEEIPTCKENCDGKLSVQAEGGNGRYKYLWPEIEQEGPLASDLCEGDYKIIITDSLSCKTDTSFYLKAPPKLALDLLTKVEPECSEGCSGEIEVYAYGGTAPYNYHWIDDGIDGNWAGGLCADIYEIKVTDFNNCVEDRKIILNGPDVIQLMVTVRREPSCEDASDGVLEVMATGGTAPYHYEWITQQEEGPLLRNIPQGIYPIKITDTAGCVYIEEVELSAPTPLQINISEVSFPTCSYGCDGWAEITPFGGTAPYTVQWNDPANQQTLRAGNLCPGIYEVKVTDKNGCISSLAVEIKETLPITIDLGGSRTLCKDQDVILDPGFDDLSYHWTSDTDFESFEQQVILKNAGNYYLQATNDKGCIAKDTFNIFTTEEKFEVNFLAASQLIVGDTALITEVCYPVADRLEWQFDKSADIIDPNDFQPRISYYKAGTYPVSLTAYYGECYEDITKHITFYNPEEAPDLTGRLILGEAGIKHVQLHPNPTDGKINMAVTMHREAPLAVFIYDSFGQELYRVNRENAIFYRFLFDISNERNGTYHMKLVSNNEMRSLKIIKAK